VTSCLTCLCLPTTQGRCSVVRHVGSVRCMPCSRIVGSKSEIGVEASPQIQVKMSPTNQGRHRIILIARCPSRGVA
jgi:hypothetical protein